MNIIEIDDTLRKEIVTSLLKTRSPSKTARRLGVDIRLVLPIHDDLTERPNVRDEKYMGLGRPEMQKYFVARKKVWEVWDNTSPEIVAAREAYEAGTHDMCSGRDGSWIILYSIPLRWPTSPRPNYFKPEIG